MKRRLTRAANSTDLPTLFATRDYRGSGIDGITRRCIHADMFSRVRNYFKEARLARMSDGALYLVRDLGPVKGGKGMKHHEMIMPLSVRGLLTVARPAKSGTDWPMPARGLGAN